MNFSSLFQIETTGILLTSISFLCFLAVYLSRLRTDHLHLKSYFQQYSTRELRDSVAYYETKSYLDKIDHKGAKRLRYARRELKTRLSPSK